MDIRTLAADEKITEPGFYQISLTRHHSQPCDGPSVTSGVLRQMELATPADVWAFHQLNPDRYEKAETDALRLGVAMAAFVENGVEGVLKSFRVHAEDKPRKPTAQQIAAYDKGAGTEAGTASVEYWRAVEADPHAWLTQAELDDICAAGKVLAADPAAIAVMSGEPEITMAWQCEETGLWVLSRPDTVSFDGSTSDYKRIASRGEPFTARMVDKRIEKHGYHQQMALAAESLERLTGEWPGVVGIVAQCAEVPYHVILREISEEALRIGQFQNRRARLRFRECLDSGHWPGPGETVGAWQPSEFFWDRLNAEMQTEGAG